MNILFDLDGTLTDSRDGITKSIAHALTAMGQPAPSLSDLIPCIGPPLFESFQQRLGIRDSCDAEKAVQIYRERYTTIGYLENELFPDIARVLKNLHEAGHKLFVATAKPHPQVQPILEHFDILKYFVNFYGVSPDQHSSGKTELIAKILHVEMLDATESFMIGDRKYDISGAINNKLTTIGAVYGYGDEAELVEAGAHYYAKAPTDILDIITRHTQKDF